MTTPTTPTPPAALAEAIFVASFQTQVGIDWRADWRATDPAIQRGSTRYARPCDAAGVLRALPEGSALVTVETLAAALERVEQDYPDFRRQARHIAAAIIEALRTEPAK